MRLSSAVRGTTALLVAACAVTAGSLLSTLDQPGAGHVADGQAQYMSRGTTTSAARGAAWHGGPVVASDGHTVTVLVSDAYGPDANPPEQWAETISRLVHGAEIASVVVHVMPLAELQGICGDDALGCYGFGRMYVPGDVVDGLAPETIATHEYGHHVALNRLNPPWAAIDWGTKRWATYAEICPRERAGQVFPGDETSRDALNPGEGFGEAYRALNEVRQGAASFQWMLVDPLFFPDQEALSLVERDVLDPWVEPTQRTLRARFREATGRAWWRVIDLPLDGTLEISASMPLASGYTVTLRTVDGSTVLHRTRWTSGAPSRTLSYVVCGMRAVRLQLWRTGGPGAVTMRLLVP